MMKNASMITKLRVFFGSRVRKGCVRSLLLIAAAGLSLAGCAATADTFPLNDQARAMGPLRINFTRTGMGYAPVTATLGSGEVLTGTVHPAFGESYGQGFASGPHGFGTATAVGMSGGNMQFVLTGPRTQLLCRGTVTLGGHGSGECRTYEGAAWTVSY